MLHIKTLASKGPSGEAIVTLSVCSYSWPLNRKKLVLCCSKQDLVDLLNELGPSLNAQADSICAKVFK